MSKEFKILESRYKIIKESRSGGNKKYKKENKSLLVLKKK